MNRAPAIVLALAAAACTQRPAPPLPSIDTTGFQPLVARAVDDASKAALAAPKDAAAAGHLGMVLHAHQQYSAAVPCYRRAEALDPGNPLWPYYLGQALAAAGQPAEALRSLDRSLALKPYPAAQLRRAEVQLDAGHPAEALAAFEQFLKAEPTNPTALYGLGRAHAALNHTAESVDAFEKALARYPDYGAAHYALAQALRQAGRSAEAAPHLAQYERHKPDVPPIADPRMSDIAQLAVNATAFIRRSLDLEAHGRIDEAIQLNLRALEADPKVAQAHVNLISLYGRTGHTTEAAEQYRKAVAIDPNLAEAHYNYGVLQLNENKPAEARQAFERTLATNPQHAGAHQNLGVLLMTTGRLSEAAAQFRATLAIDPANRHANFNLARVLIAQNNYRDAIPHLERTVTPEDDQTPGYLYALAAAYANTGRTAQALDRFRQARAMATARNQPDILRLIDRDMPRVERRLHP